MITVQQYFIGRPHSAVQESCAVDLLARVNPLIAEYTLKTGKEVPLNTRTNSRIGGEKEGGFRLPDCCQGKEYSSHKILEEFFHKLGKGAGIDVYDPHNDLDNWITDETLAKYGLYREAPGSTDGWCHLTNRAPFSKHRTFLPG